MNRGNVRMPDMYEPHGEIATRLWLLLPLRLYVGLYLIHASLVGKVAKGWLSDSSILQELLRKSIIENPDYSHGLYRWFFTHLIEPAPDMFVFMVIFGELIVGFAILTGTLTRWACAIGIFMMFNFFLAFDVSLSKPHNTTTFMVMMLVMFLTNAGRAYGFDHYLRGRAPRWLA